MVKSATVLFPYQGGTGISTSSSSTVGYFLQISTTSPYLGYTFAPAVSSFTTPTLQQVTDAGATTLNKIQFAGGTSTAAFTVQGLLTAPTGSFTYIDATSTNATFATVGTLTASNATITNVSSTNMSVSSSLLVAGKAVCLADGTNCLPTTTPTLQQVATAGNTTSLALIFAGGTSTANFVVTGTFSAQTTTLGQTAITNGLSVVGNATISGNATSSNFFATGLSGTNLSYTSATGTNHTITNGTITNLTSSNATITGGTINGTSIGATTPSTGVFTNATTTNFSASTASVTSATIGSLVATNATSTNLYVSGNSVFGNATSTNFFATTLSSTNLTYTSATGTNHTITNLTSSNVTISGGTINGTSIGATTPSTGVFTNATSTNLAVTGSIIGASLSLSGALTVSGVATLATTTVTNFTASNTSTLATTTITNLTVSGATTLNTPLPLASGGTNASLTASNGGVCYSTATGLAILAGTATTNKVLMSGASGAPSWSVPTYPNASATAGKVIRSDGTNYAASTATYPDTTTINQILYSSAANTIAGITTANNGVLVTNGTGVPSIATDIPTAVTIGSAYIYRAGGTDITVPDGGTGASSFTANGVLVGNGASTLQVTATGTANQVLTSNGGGTPPTFETLPSATWGTSTLSSGFTLTASAGTFEDTGLSITLPSAGTYNVYAIARGQISYSAGVEAFIQVKFYNSTDGVYLDNGSAGAYTNKSGSDQLKIHSIPIQTIITVNGSKTIKLYAARMSATSFIVSSIESNSEGLTRMGYFKLAN